MNSRQPTRDLLKTIVVSTPSERSHRMRGPLGTTRMLRFFGRGPRILCAVALLIVSASLVANRLPAGAQTVIPSTDPNSVVPPAFKADKSWSEEGSWHWVAESYDDSQRYTGTTYDYSVGRPLPQATYVATRVKTLAATDPCPTCVRINATEQGPPVILGGSTNDALSTAYANLDNGPRRQVQSSDGSMRWTNGAWYLNYNPTTKKFFSFTWIPDDGHPADANTLAAAPAQTLNGLGQFSLTQSIAAGSRVFPIAASYVITQQYGCVPLNTGYFSSPSCPASDPSFHDGVDIAAPLGTPILAAASGTVTFAGIDTTESGNSKIIVQLDGANAGFENVYMHWETSYVKVGDHVSAGQVIAAVGSVGYSTGPHLHFAVLSTATNQTLDPLSWLQGAIQINIGGAQAEGAYINVMRWQALIDSAAKANNVPAALIAAIMAVESSGNPNAISPAGAQGLMQIMPSELTRLGVPQESWLDPEANINAGARYLAESLSSGASIEDAAARYFGSGCDALGTCTAEYVNHVVVLYVYFDAWFSTGTAPTLTVEPFTSANVSPATTSTTAIESTTTPAETTAPAVTNPATATPSPTTAPQPTATTNTATPSPTAAPTDTAAATVSPTTSPSPTTTTSDVNGTPSASPTTSPTSTPDASTMASPTSTSDASPTATGVSSPTASPTSSATPSPTASPTPNATPSPAETSTATSTATPVATPSPTSTATQASDSTSSTPVPTPVIDKFDSPSPLSCIVGPLVSQLAPSSGATPSPDPSTGPRTCAP
jgi:murein DD-endopeptidase MepM/ murein hydrolase activator NlpD